MAERDSAAAAKHRLTAPWCFSCPLRTCADFEEFSEAELAFMANFKVEHGRAWAGEVIYQQGAARPRLFTLFSGWAARFRTLHSGERQLLAFVLPGDFVGLETVLAQSPHHSIEALTDITFCGFDPDRLNELMSRPDMAARVAWYQVLDQRHVERRMTAIGACDGRRAMADLMLDLYLRLGRRALLRGLSFSLPVTHQQLGDALGLTTVHVHRTLRGMRQEGILTLKDRRLIIHDLDRLREAACITNEESRARPLL